MHLLHFPGFCALGVCFFRAHKTGVLACACMPTSVISSRMRVLTFISTNSLISLLFLFVRPDSDGGDALYAVCHGGINRPRGQGPSRLFSLTCLFLARDCGLFFNGLPVLPCRVSRFSIVWLVEDPLDYSWLISSKLLTSNQAHLHQN